MAVASVVHSTRGLNPQLLIALHFMSDLLEAPDATPR